MAVVYIGRFQPPTNAHITNIKLCLEHPGTTYVLLGSAQEHGTEKNPFHWQVRQEMILRSLGPDADRVRCLPLYDRGDNASWVEQVKSLLKDCTEDVQLAGYIKDSSSYYLRLFPEWGFLSLPAYADTQGGGTVDATKVRAVIRAVAAGEKSRDALQSLPIPKEVRDYLLNML